MFTIKVGVMPGRLQEVVISEGTTAREIFNLAEVTVSNHEIRLDGEVIDIDDALGGGKLLVAMKQIKGNAATIKVGTMPGKLQELQVTGNETARELFELAGITLSNHEIRLDGNVISEDSIINNGRLLVSMKQIKGNSDCVAKDKEVMYVSALDEEEIEILTGNKLPTTLRENEVDLLGDCVIVNDVYLIENDMFFSIYIEKEVITEEDFIKEFQSVLSGEEMKIEPSMFAGTAYQPFGIQAPIWNPQDERVTLQAYTQPVPVEKEEQVCTCKNAIDVIERKIESVQSDLSYYNEIADRKRQDLYILQDILKDIK